MQHFIKNMNQAAGNEIHTQRASVYSQMLQKTSNTTENNNMRRQQQEQQTQNNDNNNNSNNNNNNHQHTQQQHHNHHHHHQQHHQHHHQNNHNHQQQQQQQQQQNYNRHYQQQEEPYHTQTIKKTSPLLEYTNVYHSSEEETTTEEEEEEETEREKEQEEHPMSETPLDEEKFNPFNIIHYEEEEEENEEDYMSSSPYPYHNSHTLGILREPNHIQHQQEHHHHHHQQQQQRARPNHIAPLNIITRGKHQQKKVSPIVSPMPSNVTTPTTEMENYMNGNRRRRRSPWQHITSFTEAPSQIRAKITEQGHKTACPMCNLEQKGSMNLILPCYHSVCNSCLIDCTSDRGIRCPMCYQQLEWIATDLQPNGSYRRYIQPAKL
mmetsp:Transcript_12917/g.19463  ORF Transcript_12917/g.19463 Transcript_12917/m.19463 type:complete len:379 (+) Transcript_12917:141-1277(+)